MLSGGLILHCSISPHGERTFKNRLSLHRDVLEVLFRSHAFISICKALTRSHKALCLEWGQELQNVFENSTFFVPGLIADYAYLLLSLITPTSEYQQSYFATFGNNMRFAKKFSNDFLIVWISDRCWVLFKMMPRSQNNKIGSKPGRSQQSDLFTYRKAEAKLIISGEHRGRCKASSFPSFEISSEHTMISGCFWMRIVSVFNAKRPDINCIVCHLILFKKQEKSQRGYLLQSAPFILSFKYFKKMCRINLVIFNLSWKNHGEFLFRETTKGAFQSELAG